MQVLPKGVRHIPGCLSPDEQRALLDDIRAVAEQAPLYTPRMPRTGKPMSVRMTNCGPLGWVTDKERGYRYQATHPETGKPWPPMPRKLLDLWAEFSGYPHAPEACLVNFYADTAKMGLHQDRDEEDFDAPVLSVSLGDTCLFLTMNRLGPRRSNILFSTNAPISALLGWLFLGETIVAQKIVGIAIVFAGVILAIVFGKRRSQLDTWESVKGPLPLGIALGLTAALCQSVGSLIARPVMESGVDPATASALRVGVSVICLSLLMATGWKAVQPKAALTMRTTALIAISGIAAMGVGMTLVLFGLSGGKVGIIATLSATTPAWILPLIWIRTRERPAAFAWVGAALVILGSGLIFAA